MSKQEERKQEFLKSIDKDFYEIMAQNFGEEIFVTDGQGKVLFINPASSRDINAAPENVVGRFVGDLVNEGMFKPSVSLEVIRLGRQVNMIQTLYDGKKVLVTGVPVFDDDGKTIKMVVSTTKKVDEITEIYDRMEHQEAEIHNLREMAFQNEGMILGSEDVAIKEAIIRLAPLEIPVLITGETGVGKEVAAKVIHQMGKGKSWPFVKINCGTIPENLIESELFGYEPGAFTGASAEGKMGKIEMAEGGTLFLDEIGELPLLMQVKLLDFIQDGTFTRVGGTEERKVHTRIISATNRNLKEMCEQGEFRKDLYFRLNVVPFEIPPLRERNSDLDALIAYFVTECNSRYQIKKRLTHKAIELMHEYEWPGNVRELQHIIEQVHIFSDSKTITDADVMKVAEINGQGEEIGPERKRHAIVNCEGLMPLKEAKHEVEKQLVLQAYEQYGSTYKAAKALQVDQSTVSKILKKYSE